MHTLFLLSALLMAAVLSGLGALLLRMMPAGGRRVIALVVLAVPLFVLGLATLHVIPWFWSECTPLVGWDRIATIGLLTVLGGVAAGALGLNLARLVLIDRLLVTCPPLIDRVLTARFTTLAEQLHMNPPALRLLHADTPLAVTGGFRRPVIVVSSWLVEQLDQRELDAVLAHELAHLGRHDHLTHWLGRLLRDAVVYLPGSWYALRVLEADGELEADARALETTGRPLAMASALGKVWQAVLPASGPVGLADLPGYSGTAPALLEERLFRLLKGRARRSPTLPGRLLAGVSVLSLGEITPRLLALSVSALPLACNVQPY